MNSCFSLYGNVYHLFDSFLQIDFKTQMVLCIKRQQALGFQSHWVTFRCTFIIQYKEDQKTQRQPVMWLKAPTENWKHIFWREGHSFRRLSFCLQHKSTLKRHPHGGKSRVCLLGRGGFFFFFYSNVQMLSSLM